jgi:hypothetical protein
MRHKRHAVFNLRLPILAAFFLAITSTKAQTSTHSGYTLSNTAGVQTRYEEAIPVTISFQEAISEAEALKFVQTYAAKPYAIYMSACGLSGVHRVSEFQASEQIISEAREEAIRIHKRALGQFTLGIVALAKNSSFDEFNKLSYLQREAKKLVYRADQAKNVEKAAEEDRPIIYGLELLVMPDQLISLRTDQRVALAEKGSWLKGRSIMPIATLPLSLAGQSWPESTEGWTTARLYDEIQSRTRETEK